MKINIKDLFAGIGIGILNGFLGAGGGMLAVPYLKFSGLSQKEAHENAVAVILPITVISALAYIVKGYVTVGESLLYLPTGVLGAVIGTFFLKNIDSKLLKKLFGVFAVYAGFRLLVK